jgi:secondary thiamine-phosphate synthase enzyme
MQVYQTYVYIKTKGVGIFHDLTDVLRSELEKSLIQNGILVVSLLHTTCALLMQEPEEGVHHDARLVLNNITPTHLNYNHLYEGLTNAKAHQRQMLIGAQIIIPVKNNSLVLGQWQKPFLIELFTAMERKLFITIIGEQL